MLAVVPEAARRLPEIHNRGFGGVVSNDENIGSWAWIAGSRGPWGGSCSSAGCPFDGVSSGGGFSGGGGSSGGGGAFGSW